MAAPITFYFDYISPYAYVAWKAIHRIAAGAGREVAPRPTLFAAVLDARGQKGPAEIPEKRVYTFKDAYRKAHAHGLPPLVPPPGHPFNPLLPLRVTAALEGADQRRAIDALFDAAWATGAGVDTPERVAAALTPAGLDGAALVARASDPALKERVRATTTAALEAGAFGVPTMIVDGELFWGVDSLSALEAFLAGRDPLPPDLLQRWAELPASATRRAR
jgi:2-hydroxychromene-2-carboxylate isomerase